MTTSKTDCTDTMVERAISFGHGLRSEASCAASVQELSSESDEEGFPTLGQLHVAQAIQCALEEEAACRSANEVEEENEELGPTSSSPASKRVLLRSSASNRAASQHANSEGAASASSSAAITELFSFKMRERVAAQEAEADADNRSTSPMISWSSRPSSFSGFSTTSMSLTGLSEEGWDMGVRRAHSELSSHHHRPPYPHSHSMAASHRYGSPLSSPSGPSQPSPHRRLSSVGPAPVSSSRDASPIPSWLRTSSHGGSDCSGSRDASPLRRSGSRSSSLGGGGGGRGGVRPPSVPATWGAPSSQRGSPTSPSSAQVSASSAQQRLLDTGEEAQLQAHALVYARAKGIGLEEARARLATTPLRAQRKSPACDGHDSPVAQGQRTLAGGRRRQDYGLLPVGVVHGSEVVPQGIHQLLEPVSAPSGAHALPSVTAVTPGALKCLPLPQIQYSKVDSLVSHFRFKMHRGFRCTVRRWWPQWLLKADGPSLSFGAPMRHKLLSLLPCTYE